MLAYKLSKVLLYIFLGIKGIFRSLDRGKTWTSIGDPTKSIGNDPNVMEASLEQEGLVFIGTNGRGIYYGTP
ncbi:xyloglucanase Xgh74A [Calothrix sp. NIES-4071]|nr:xyloglucanase Xgh74A [Calothrix sp. NIES-4071]BAZ59463.1 xyloglucanase Xgh74A [Calothrix sp. NIES-4105]